MKKLKGLATGIGSLPHIDVHNALDLIFKYVPQMPFWPQLPQRNKREGMVAQFSQGFPCLRVGEEGIYFDPLDKEKELEAFYAKIIDSDELDYFAITEEFAPGLYALKQRVAGLGEEHPVFVKCQITGPFTFAASINDEKGTPLLHDPVFMQAIIKGLSRKALWQLKFFEECGRRVIFIDEPYLGSFGSAFTPIGRDQVIQGLGEFTEGLKSEGVLLGVHCCGNTDWSMFTEIASVDIISFDAFSYLERFVLYADNLKSFLKRGGAICWGIVPTQLFSGEETVDLLIRSLKEGINALTAKGIEERLLLENLLISPACGLGTFTPEKAEKIFKLLSHTSQAIGEYP